MMRITCKYAVPGMMLGLSVYDNFGNILFHPNTKLTKNDIKCIIDNDVPEIFIYDNRLTDLVVAPLFHPQSQGYLAVAVRNLVQRNTNGAGIDGDSIGKVHKAIGELVKDMHSNVLGDVNVSCFILPQYYAYIQPVKTAALAMAIGNILKLPDEDLVNIGMAAVLKDIGLPLETVNAVDSLSEGGSARMQNHPIVGYNLLVQNKLTNKEVAEAILQHHEAWNGSGYPRGLKESEISPNARIITLADAFIDLLSERPGRAKYMPHVAIEYIMAFNGDLFDPEIVEYFVRWVPSYPTGISVKLNNGDRGVVSDSKQGYIARPVVRICSTVKEGTLEEPYDFDLSIVANQRTLITEVLGYD